MAEFFAEHQLLLWILTVFADLGFAVLAYRLFGRTGLYGVVIFSLLLANMHHPDWVWLTAFVGLNLFQSAFTNWCPMITLLRKLGVKEG